MMKPSFSGRLKRPTAAPVAAGAGGGFWPKAVAAVLWLAAGSCAGYGLLQVAGRGPLTPVSAIAGNPLQADAAMVAQALGAVPEVQAAAPAAPPMSSRFQLMGLVSQPGQRGAALIAVDGQPPRPVSIGAVVDGDLVLQSVGRRVARLGTGRGGPVALELSLPEPPEGTAVTSTE